MATKKAIVLDNGGHFLKIGWAGDPKPTKVLYNFSAKGKSDRKNWIGDEIDSCIDIASLVFRRPIEKGFVSNWEQQKEVWDRAFQHLRVSSPKDYDLLLTETPFAPQSIRQLTWEVIFEDYQFASLCSTSAPFLSSIRANLAEECSLVIDSGYSYTHVVPFSQTTMLEQHVKRINVGGKVLTNYLKEIVSYRYWNMMEETFLMNIIKEKLCYVSQNFMGDMRAIANGSRELRREYVLPDYTTTQRGHIRDPNSSHTPSQHANGTHDPTAQKPKGEEQVLLMNNERVTVAEALFNPSDLGIPQAGIPETIFQALRGMSPEAQSQHLQRIVLTGGNVRFPGFVQRLQTELREYFPSEANLRMIVPEDPVTFAWEGGSRMASNPNLASFSVSRAQWAEHGPNACKNLFRF